MFNTFNLKEKYDCIVIGAGPGGSRLAELCSQKGLDVLLLEKRPEIGAPKRCGEGMEKKDLLDMGFGEDEKFMTNTITRDSLVYTPGGQAITLPVKNKRGCIIERKLFDKEMASRAALAGAKIITNADVVDLIKENGFVRGVEVEYEGEKRKIKSGVVVSAEGVEAKNAKKALNIALPKPDEMMSGYQYELENIIVEDSMRLEFYIGVDIVPGGYIWIFPKGKRRANVGIGIISNCQKSAKYYLDKWIETKANIRCGSVLEENAGAIPVGGFLKKMTANGFLAIGDAARQVHPIHGGGLYESTYAAKIAAEVINEAKIADDYSDRILDKYNKMWWAKRGNKLLRVNKLKKIFQRMSDDDLNSIFKLINEKKIYSLIGGNLDEFSHLILKIPKFIKFTKYII
ncbi:MAG: NAD(P)/FAD-dependent oxidoreductase [Candidatus Aenigmarchaeota archaeon]|nr:NAD(P)/FAD-dependent oxidoreductase [Candidatus Aenigmarchaeota archaeon]